MSRFRTFGLIRLASSSQAPYRQLRCKLLRGKRLGIYWGKRKEMAFLLHPIVNSWRVQMLQRDWQHPKKNSTARSPRRILEDRVVFCVDCDTNRALTTDTSGQLVCSVCTSTAWMYVSAPLIANFHEYSERLAEATAAGNAFARTCPVL